MLRFFLERSTEHFGNRAVLLFDREHRHIQAVSNTHAATAAVQPTRTDRLAIRHQRLNLRDSHSCGRGSDNRLVFRKLLRSEEA
jgi:hypothetical protein